MKTIKFKEYECYHKILQYANGLKAIKLFDINDNSLVAIATVNPEEALGLEMVNNAIKHGYTFIKDYSENEGIYESLYKSGLVGEIDYYFDIGYPGTKVICCKIND